MKKDRLYIALSKKKKTAIDYGIAGWTAGKYVHAELVLNGMSFSSCGPEGGVRKKLIHYVDKSHWDLYEVLGDYTREDILEVYNFYNLTEHCKYDFKGIMLAQFLFFVEKQNSDEFFCSEWVEIAINHVLHWDKIDPLFAKGYKFSPNRLWKKAADYELIKEETDRTYEGVVECLN